MSDQLVLAGQEPPLKLTDRQQYALELIAKLGPVPSDELGAHMHERRGKHTADARCQWCGEEGKSVGKELRRKGLVKQRRGEGWISVGPGTRSQARAGGYDPETAEWPEGF